MNTQNETSIIFDDRFTNIILNNPLKVFQISHSLEKDHYVINLSFKNLISLFEALSYKKLNNFRLGWNNINIDEGLDEKDIKSLRKAFS